MSLVKDTGLWISGQTRDKEDIRDHYLSENWKRESTSEKQHRAKLHKVTEALAQVLTARWPGRPELTDAAGTQSGAPSRA